MFTLVINQTEIITKRNHSIEMKINSYKDKHMLTTVYPKGEVRVILNIIIINMYSECIRLISLTVPKLLSIVTEQFEGV